MIAPITIKPLAALKAFKVAPRPNSKELSRVFAAAVVSRQFRDLLLHNPREALSKGYLGESFSLTAEESDLIISIRAETLGELAKQVHRSLSIND